MAENFQERVLAYACDLPVSLFLARLPLRLAHLYLQAQKAREPWFDTENRINEFVPVVGILWPVAKAAEFLDWAARNELPGHPSPRSDDAVLGRWGALTNQIFRFTIPCLIQHPDEEPSTIGRTAHWGEDAGRVALSF